MTDQIDNKKQDVIQTVRGDDAPAIPAGLIAARNGALRDPKTGRIVTTPGGGTKAITKETTEQYHEMRKERFIQAAYNGIISGADQRTLDASVETIYAAQTRLALNEMAGRASTEAARFVVNTSGLAPDRKDTDNTTARDIGRGIADVLCRLLQDNALVAGETNVIDAEFTEKNYDNG